MNEETRFDANEANNEQNVNPVSQNEPKDKKETASQHFGRKGAAIAAAGAAAGAIGSIAAMGFIAPNNVPEPIIPMPTPQSDTVTPGQGNETVVVSQMPVAHGVDDGMTFSQAFASARQEVGAGGLFEWRGNVYSTYYAEEWQGLSDTQRTDINNYPYVRQDDVIVVPEPPEPDPNTRVVGAVTIANEDGYEVIAYDLDGDGKPDVMTVVNEDGIIEAIVPDPERAVLINTGDEAGLNDVDDYSDTQMADFDNNADTSLFV